MSWHIRYLDPALGHELLSPEFSMRDEAFEAAVQLASDDMEILAIEGPDDESVPADEISAWFESRATQEPGLNSGSAAPRPLP